MDRFEIRDSFVVINKNQKIFGITHKPLHIAKPPVVLMCHGLGGHKTGRYRVYIELAETLVRSGIAVVRFDFRGSGDSEGSLNEITIEDELSDAMAILNFIKNSGEYDLERLGMFGRSLGAAIAVQTAAITGIVKSLVLWVPLFNGLQWEKQWEKVQNGEISTRDAIELRRINGQVASLEFYAQMFNLPTEKALEKLKNVPMLIIHGEKDELIAISHSELYTTHRKTAEEETLFIRLPHCDHDFSYTAERQAAILETGNWFQRTLGHAK